MNRSILEGKISPLFRLSFGLDEREIPPAMPGRLPEFDNFGIHPEIPA